MEAGGLQRSTTSFRRQGSSGLVWDNDKYLSGEMKQQNKEKAAQSNTGSNGKMQRSRSTGGAIYRTVKVSSSPNIDPPSPKVSACGFCVVFGKPASTHQRKSSSKR